MCVFAKFAPSTNMTCLLISAIIVCVVFVQEFANKQTEAIKHTRLQIINEKAKSRLEKNDKDKYKTGEASAVSRLNMNCVKSSSSQNPDSLIERHIHTKSPQLDVTLNGCYILV